jgi:hypothetical protein
MVDNSNIFVPNNANNGATDTFSNIVLTGITQDNTQNNILVLNAQDTLNTRTLSSTNPFNQSLNTTDSPTFDSLDLNGQLILNTNFFHPLIINNSTNTTGNDILFEEDGTQICSFGDNIETQTSYCWNYVNRDFKIGTNDIERLRILGTGIADNDGATQLLALSAGSTVLQYRNVSSLIDATSLPTLAIVSTDGSSNLFGTQLINGQVMIGSSAAAPVAGVLVGSNVTITSGPGTITISLPQSVSTTATPKFSSIQLTATSSQFVLGTTPNLTTLNAPASSGAVTLNFPNIADTICGRTTTDTLSSKSIDSASNTITVNSTNINSLLNQAVLTSSQPTFENLTLGIGGIGGGLTLSVPLTIDNTQTSLLCRTSGGILETRASTSIPSLIAAKYHLATSQLLSNTTATIISYDTTDVSSTNITYSAGTFTINTAGLYIWTCTTSYAASTVGFRMGWIIYNALGVASTQRLSEMGVTVSSAAVPAATNHSVVLKMSATDTLQMYGYQNTAGGTLNVLGLSTDSANYCSVQVGMIINS